MQMAFRLQLAWWALAVLLTIVSGSSTCPTGWQEFDNSCYVFLNETISCLSAVVQCVNSILSTSVMEDYVEAFCSKEGAELVEITSEKENNFVVKLLTTKDGLSAWLGVNDIIQDGQWVYFSSQSPLSYNNFYPNRPKSKRLSSKGCALLLANGMWLEMFCRLTFNAICEMNMASDF
ncbi:low affinity immunoglobulin epsilon Fc receptor-like isoform X1 [Pomacea canaliculata]|uniref:low affinity immunoglobulin epsilon Fc receptor-like isoform X1 n=1 Tax=Pomacea canaliculata TaxID=400727 RepID=UPI000D729001|nr:low affinity immunoglobulin epsilon Fc receptor-like isoform X1 [Pomacea canaliculata]